MRILATGIAAIALAASAYAQPGQGGDQGNRNDRAGAQNVGNARDAGQGNRGSATKPGPQGERRAEQGPAARPDSRGQGNAAGGRVQGAERANSQGEDRGQGQAQSQNQGQSRANRDVAPGRADRGASPAQGNGRDVARNAGGDRHIYSERGWSPRITTIDYRFGLRDGCPPGLAKKYNGCTPPGLAREPRPVFGFASYEPDWWGYRNYADGRYRYSDGYLLRIGSGGLVDAFIPLLGGALAAGNPWPGYYEPVPLNPYYVEYYDLGPPRGYRYADDVIYRVDPETAAISSIAALLTGDEFVVGQPVPPGYDVYNVPYDYRERYYDRPDARYRYSDGYVYEVDPETMLVVSAIQLLV